MDNEQVITIKKVVETPLLQDSIEIGTPGKGGALKIYGDFSDQAGFETRIRGAMKLRALAGDLLGGSA